jgi:mRNA interferase MazF
MVQEIRRGEIYWVDWSPGRGSEQTGVRPSLVIQNDLGNKYSPTIIVATLTTAIERPYSFLVRVSARESGLPKDSIINVSAILTVDKKFIKNKCGELSSEKMKQVDEAIKVSLGL